MILRYTGQQATTFKAIIVQGVGSVNVGTVTPGETFTVPDALAERFTRRADIEVIPPDEAQDAVPEPPQSPRSASVPSSRRRPAAPTSPPGAEPDGGAGSVPESSSAPDAAE